MAITLTNGHWFVLLFRIIKILKLNLYCIILKFKYCVKTARENLNRVVKFQDLEPDDKKFLNVSIAPYVDSTFETKLIEIDTGIQV